MSNSNFVDILLEEQEGTESRVSNWHKTIGESVKLNDPICDLETDKVNMEIAAPSNGILAEILKNPGDKVNPGEVLGRISLSEISSIPLKPIGNINSTNESKLTLAPPIAKGSDAPLLSPAVKYLLKMHNLDFQVIKGTGRNQRITREDVLQYLDLTPDTTSQSKIERSSPVIHKENTQSNSGTIRKIPHSPMRRKIADHMVNSLLKEAPHVTSIFEADLTNIIEHRKWHKKEFNEEGVNLTFTAYFLKASAIAIKAVPEVNSRYHEDFLEVFEFCNIGIGTALGDKGLVVPVIKNVENLSLLEIAKKLSHYTEKARANKISGEDLKGGTFTISNHGVSGSLVATPIIINQPQSAILGIGKMQKRVVVETVDGKDEIKIKPMAYITLSIDHRALDAHQTNLFLSHFVETIETWGQ